jgi:hypothetical protein
MQTRRHQLDVKKIIQTARGFIFRITHQEQIIFGLKGLNLFPYGYVPKQNELKPRLESPVV